MSKKENKIDSIMCWSIHGIELNHTKEIKNQSIPSEGDILRPFLQQSYEYSVKTVVKHGGVYYVDLHPISEHAKTIFKNQHKSLLHLN